MKFNKLSHPACSPFTPHLASTRKMGSEGTQFILYLFSCLPLFYLAWNNRNYQLDDALIYLRYIRNFFNGSGLVYNPGDYFNGLTSPLYSYLVILAGLIIDNLQFANILLATICHASGLIIFSKVFFAERSLIARCLFIILAGTFPYFFLVYGMETPLFILMTGLCLYCYQIKKYFWLGIFSGLLILTRVEGGFLVAALLGGYLIKNRTLPSYRYFIIPLALITGNLIFNKLYYGAYLPATGSAKVWQGQSGLWGDGWLFLHVDYLFGWVFNSNYFYGLTLATLVLAGFASSIKKPANREIHLITATFLIGYSCFFIFLNIPNYHWYYAPYFIFAIVYCTQGILLIADILGTMFDSPLKWVGHISALLLAATLIYWAISIASITRGSFTPYKNIGIWLNQNTQENAKIALVEIGTVGWYSDRPIIDILGLVNPLNARFIGERKLEEWLNHYSPDYILIHDPPWPHEVGAEKALAMGRFKLDIRFDFQGYKLLSQVSSEVRQP